jgi:hypothetical protein
MVDSRVVLGTWGTQRPRGHPCSMLALANKVTVSEPLHNSWTHQISGPRGSLREQKDLGASPAHPGVLSHPSILWKDSNWLLWLRHLLSPGRGWGGDLCGPFRHRADREGTEQNFWWPWNQEPGGQGSWQGWTTIPAPGSHGPGLSLLVCRTQCGWPSWGEPCPAPTPGCPHSRKFTGLPHSLLGLHSVPQLSFILFYFNLPRLALNHSPPDLCILSN